MAITLPPLPLKSVVINERGILTPLWATWFRELFQRIGGTTALSNIELEEQIDTSSLNIQIQQLKDDVSILQAELANMSSNFSDLGQGPVA